MAKDTSFETSRGEGGETHQHIPESGPMATRSI